MAHRLDGARLKLDRANEHLDAFEAESTRYLDGDVFMLARDDSVEDTVFDLWVKEEPPPRLSVIAGDCLHNLRSALEHMAWQLVLANGETPGRDTAFPIVTEPVEEDAFGKRYCRGMSLAASALLERMQPYQAGAEASTHVLAFLKELSNADKHKMLKLTVMSLKGNRVRILSLNGDRVIAEADLAGVVFRHGQRIAAFPIPYETLGDDVKFETIGDKFIALQDAGPWGPEEPILKLLEITYRNIRFGVLPQVEELPEMH